MQQRRADTTNMGVHRLLVELDVTTADLPPRRLAANLMMCTEAGLYGLSHQCVRLELDGVPYPTVTDGAPDRDGLLAAPDPRVSGLVRDLEAVLGLARRLRGPTAA